MVLLALFGAVMGQGVIWYTGQFYAQTFIENICKVNFVDSRNILLIAILFATPCFVIFGSLSDKIGRKWIMLLGMLLAVFSYRMVYQNFLDYTNVAAKRPMIDLSKTTKSDPIAAVDAKDKKKALVSIKYDSVYTDGAVYTFTKTDTVHFASEYAGNTASIGYIMAKKDSSGILDTAMVKVKTAAGVILPEGITYIGAEKKSAKPGVVIEKSLDRTTFWKMVFWVFILIVYVTMVYGPMAAFLVEMFPTKIRYTSMSLPYHIGNGVFGGLVPFLGTLIVEFTKTKDNPGGDPLAGLWYPIGVAILCIVIGAIYLSNRIDDDVMD
jgi:MFS family permease